MNGTDGGTTPRPRLTINMETTMPTATQTPTTPTRRAAIGFSLAAFAAGLATPALASTPNPDAELIALGRAMEAAWIEEKRAFAADEDDSTLAQQALLQTGTIVDQIEAVRATTIEGLAVKRRALAWCFAGGPVTAEELCDQEFPTTDFRIIASILDDLSAGSAAA
jgi:hypothetical protein